MLVAKAKHINVEKVHSILYSLVFMLTKEWCLTALFTGSQLWKKYHQGVSCTSLLKIKFMDLVCYFKYNYHNIINTWVIRQGDHHTNTVKLKVWHKNKIPHDIKRGGLELTENTKNLTSTPKSFMTMKLTGEMHIWASISEKPTTQSKYILERLLKPKPEKCFTI